MNFDEKIELVKKKLEQAKIEDAIEILGELTQIEDDINNRLIIIKSQCSYILNAQAGGTISQEDFQIELTKISNRIIQ
ncbi:MAG: hypothetical protein AAFU64_16125, partial [Bacteroidota bacterium]